MPDPVVRPGDWIADVTYERQQQVVFNPLPGWASQNPTYTESPLGGLPELGQQASSGTTCRRSGASGTRSRRSAPRRLDDHERSAAYRSMVVYVNQNLQSRGRSSRRGQPAYVNAALIAPNVINVIPQTIFIRSVIWHGTGGPSSGGRVSESVLRRQVPVGQAVQPDGMSNVRSTA